MKNKHVIMDVPPGIFKASEHNTALLYLDKKNKMMFDELVDEDFNHTGSRFCSQKQKVVEEIDGNMAEVEREVVLIPEDLDIIKVHQYASWNAVGNEDQQ